MAQEHHTYHHGLGNVRFAVQNRTGIQQQAHQRRVIGRNRPLQVLDVSCGRILVGYVKAVLTGQPFLISFCSSDAYL